MPCMGTKVGHEGKVGELWSGVNWTLHKTPHLSRTNILAEGYAVVLPSKVALLSTSIKEVS